MEERRKFLKSLGATTVGATAAGVAGSLAVDANGEAAATTPAAPVKIDPRLRDAFPDVEVTAHTGEKFRFYDDLIRDKVVMINFMSTRNEQGFPVTAKMADIAAQLGDRLGKDVFIISISRDPAYDTPRRLAAFAQKHGVGKGWYLVTGTYAAAGALETRMYRHKHESGALTSALCTGRDRKVDIVFYGNGGAGVWGTFPVDIRPDDAATRITWVMPGKMPTGAPRRAGPRRLNAAERLSHNRDA